MAGRETLEVGLHRRASLLENFKDTPERDLAMRCFWCVYILDRRWSYGTSLSFGISDRDIDPQLPEPVRKSYGVRKNNDYVLLTATYRMITLTFAA